jgi:hypothetical protein
MGGRLGKWQLPKVEGCWCKPKLGIACQTANDRTPNLIVQQFVNARGHSCQVT